MAYTDDLRQKLLQAVDCGLANPSRSTFNANDCGRQDRQLGERQFPGASGFVDSAAVGISVAKLIAESEGEPRHQEQDPSS